MDYTITSRSFDEPRTDYAAIAWPILIWLAAIVVANPLGEFPLEDDWSYSLAVRNMMELHSFHPLGWTSMSLFGQTIWGALFSLPFGFSFFTVRVSTIVAGALGLAACSTLLQQLGCDRRKTMFATLVLGFNPIYFVLSSTFMTDVGFAATCLFSTLFFCRYLLTQRVGCMLAAILFGLWATSIRQPGLFLPIAMFLTVLVVSPRNLRALLLTAAGVAATWGFLKGLNAWMIAHNVLPDVYLDQVSLFGKLIPESGLSVSALTRIVSQDFWYFRGALEFVGWSLFPLLAWRLPSLVRDFARRPRGKLVLIAAALYCAVWFANQVIGHRLLPFNTWTTIHPAGLGPVWLPDANATGYDLPSLPAPFWIFVTFLGTLGGVIVVLDVALSVIEIVAAYRARTRGPQTHVRVFLLLTVFVYLPPFIAFGHFDRYLLPLLAPLLLLVMTERNESRAATTGTVRSTQPARTSWNRPVRAVAWFALALTASFAVAGTHDYLNWSRARWMLVDTLFAHGVPANRVDGGYEFNGMYRYDPKFDFLKAKGSWWVVDDEYRIQFQQSPGYRIIDRADANGWLPPFRRQLFTLHREAG